MHHIAIMKKSWNFIPKILLGDKTIESRWYFTRRAPWNRINVNDTVYFKNSGEKIIAKANVLKVLQFADLNETQVINLVDKYHKEIGVVEKDKEKFLKKHINKRYAILIFINKPEPLEAFSINKTGFGNAAAWLCVNDIKNIKH